MPAHLLNLLTTVLEVAGAVAFVVGVCLVFGLGWALMFAGALLVGASYVMAPSSPAGDSS